MRRPDPRCFKLLALGGGLAIAVAFPPAVSRAASTHEETSAALRIDSNFSGGNIVVDRIEGDTVWVRPDLRDTEGWWFYWYFRVRGAAGREINFQFPGRAVGLRGPGISHDGGASWQWLGSREGNQGFRHRFGPGDDEVRFSFGLPYQYADLRRFLARHHGNPHLRVEELGKTRRGTPVERLHLGDLIATPAFKVLVTCRYHACEMMASYVLEGLMEEVLAGKEAGGPWLRQRVEMVVIPLVDKDGVEAGDQGKNRKPHDHKADHRGPGLYPEVVALRTFVQRWAQGRADVSLDLHNPNLDGNFIYTHALRTEGVTMAGENAQGRNRSFARQFLDTLERVQRGPLPFRVQDSVEFAARMAAKNAGGPTRQPAAPAGAAARAAAEAPKIAVGFEIPYADVRGVEVNPTSARALGVDLARALAAYLQGLPAPPLRTAP